MSRLRPLPRRPRPSAPIALQIAALLVGSLVAAQLATLALTLLLPPEPPEQHSLADIAAGLRGRPSRETAARPLLLTLENEPPSLSSPGWMASERSSADLARLLDANPDDVRLLFYAPPPFAGAAGPPPRQRAALDASLLLAAVATPAYAQPPMRAPPMMVSGGAPGFFPTRPSVGPGSVGVPLSAAQGGPLAGRPGAGFARGGGDYRRAREAMAASRDAAPRPQRPSPSARDAIAPMTDARQAPPRAWRPAPLRIASDPLFSAPFRASGYAASASEAVASASPVAAPSPPPITDHTVTADPPLTERVAPTIEAVRTPPRLAAAQALAPSTARAPVPQGRPLPAPAARGLFGLAPAPYIEGDFVAALRQPDGRWATLRPKSEGFPNNWQRRVLLWFLVSFAIVGPVGYLFARRLAAPLAGFADAAEALGRDPTSPVLAADGPAEVGRAARAFNQMQARLTRFINDRTAMIGAISHDLRTPLTRMRFRLERATPALRREIGQDIDQMEAMINSVLAFMRDSAEAGARQHVDLRSLIECVVDDAEITGGDVVLDPGPAPQVEIDVLGLQRVFANLVDNAVKYGDSAQVRLYVDGDEAVTEIRDRGPGMSEDELGRVFTPFYRSVAARTSSKQGVGLGLATSRTTVRAHGGEIRLSNTGEGLMAQVRLPLARQRGGAQPEPPALQAAE